MSVLPRTFLERGLLQTECLCKMLVKCLFQKINSFGFPIWAAELPSKLYFLGITANWQKINTNVVKILSACPFRYWLIMALLRIKRTMNFVPKWKIWCCHHKGTLEYLQPQGDLQVRNVTSYGKCCGDFQSLQERLVGWLGFYYWCWSIIPIFDHGDIINPLASWYALAYAFPDSI